MSTRAETRRTKWIGNVSRAVHGRPADGIPKRIVTLAYLVPLTTLPSGIWRILTVTLKIPLVQSGGTSGGDLPSWLPTSVYVVILSLCIETLAALAIGLVSPWGEVFPRWIPLLGGRDVPVAAAAVPAAIGSAVLTIGGLWTAITMILGRTIELRPAPAGSPGRPHTLLQQIVFDTAYGPLIAWGPLLAIVTIAYYRRRTGRPGRTAQVMNK